MMVIRNFHKKKNIKRFLKITIWIVIGSIIVARLTNIIYYEITEKNNKEIVVWEKINFYWEITDENNFPLYTHKIVDKWWENVFLKSSSINLNKFSWKVEIHWEIINVKKDTPIIDVVSIKLPEQWLIISKNNYLFVKDMLYFEFENQPQLSAKKNNKEIEIFYEKDKISNIERFVCSRVLRQKDCSYLIEDYWKSQKDNFDSYRWYTYYKHGTGLRTVFDGKMFWYIFKDIEEENMLNLSNIIRIVDKNFILKNKKEIIQKACLENWEKIEQIWWSSLQYDDDNKVNITIDSNQSNYACKVTIDIRNERKITETKIIEKKK